MWEAIGDGNVPFRARFRDLGNGRVWLDSGVGPLLEYTQSEVADMARLFSRAAGEPVVSEGTNSDLIAMPTAINADMPKNVTITINVTP